MPAEVKIYECEVKKLFKKKNGTNEWRWVVRPVKDAIKDGVTEFRCKDCHGAVKLHGRRDRIERDLQQAGESKITVAWGKTFC